MHLVPAHAPAATKHLALPGLRPAPAAVRPASSARLALGTSAIPSQDLVDQLSVARRCLAVGRQPRRLHVFVETGLPHTHRVRRQAVLALDRSREILTYVLGACLAREVEAAGNVIRLAPYPPCEWGSGATGAGTVDVIDERLQVGLYDVVLVHAANMHEG